MFRSMRRARAPSIRLFAPWYKSRMPSRTYTCIFSSTSWPLIRSCTRMFALFAPIRYTPWLTVRNIFVYHLRRACVAVTKFETMMSSTARPSCDEHSARCATISRSSAWDKRGMWHKGQARRRITRSTSGVSSVSSASMSGGSVHARRSVHGLCSSSSSTRTPSSIVSSSPNGCFPKRLKKPRSVSVVSVLPRLRSMVCSSSMSMPPVSLVSYKRSISRQKRRRSTAYGRYTASSCSLGRALPVPNLASSS